MVDAKTLGLLQVVALGLAVAVVCLLLFACLRPRLPHVYQHRRVLNRYAAHDDYNGKRVAFVSARPTRGPLGWLRPTLSVGEPEIVARHGLDAAMFLRFMRSQVQSFAVAALVCCAVLMPVYATAGNKSLPDTDPKLTVGLQVVSLSNVPVGNVRLWATVAVEYIVCAVFLFFLARDIRAYVKYRRAYRMRENPANYAVVVYDIPAGENTQDRVRARFELMVEGQVGEVVLARKAKKGIKAEKALEKLLVKQERVELLRASTGEEALTRPGTCGVCAFWRGKVPAAGFYAAEVERLEGEVLEAGQLAENANAAIVLFRNKRAASLIAQANQGNNANEWVVHRAGEPEAVHWPAFHVPAYQVLWRTLAVLALVLFLTFFWIIPATAIMGLANLQSLSRVPGFGWADELSNGFLVGFIEALLPALILSVFLSLIPTFFRLALSQTRLHSLHIIESKTRNYFYFFSIFASFVFIVFAGSALTDLEAMREDPSQISVLLAAAVPRNGIFFASFVLLKTFIPLAVMLLNPGRVLVRWIKLKLAKTERERRAAEGGGAVFQYFKMYGQAMMMSLIGLAYSTLAPLVILTVFIFYCVSYIVFKHNIVFASYRKWDGGGWDYPGAFYSVVVSLVIKQLTMIGVFSLYEAPIQTALAILPLIVTILFGLWAHNRYSRVALHGSLHDQYTAASKLDEIPARYYGLYRPPGVSLKPYKNLSGVEDPRDIYAHEDADGYAPSAYQSVAPLSGDGDWSAP